MENKDIVKLLRKTAALMELHGENEFKVRGYSNAVFNIERLNSKLSDLSEEELSELQGIGKSIASRIKEILDTGTLSIYEDYLKKTPPGLLDMMDVKGLGIKKIVTLWNDAGIDSLDKLEDALASGALSDIKGFGEKTRENLLKSIRYLKQNRIKLHYAKAEKLANEIIESLKSNIPQIKAEVTGELRRKLETISSIDIILDTQDYKKVENSIKELDVFTIDEKKSSPFLLSGTYGYGTAINLHLTNKEDYQRQLLITTGSTTHLTRKVSDQHNILQLANGAQIDSEEEFYKSLGLSYIPPEIREGQFEFDLARSNKIPRLIETDDLKGIVHNHSTYSDGQNTLREMAEYCRELGYEYLGIADHSKAAFFYANGLDEDRVKQQQKEIDQLNKELAPFKIFKGIEADILTDGSLDYDDETLSTFDFVVASIHSGLSMDEKKATERLLTAIANPYTTILGHPTGRLLLIREGYPLDMKAIIDACAEHGVIIEINAHPHRLDLDWRWVHYALEQGVMLSINPDAHEKKGYFDMYYGVCVGRKGGLTAKDTFNAMSIDEVEKYLKARKDKALKAVTQG